MGETYEIAVKFAANTSGFASSLFGATQNVNDFLKSVQDSGGASEVFGSAMGKLKGFAGSPIGKMSLLAGGAYAVGKGLASAVGSAASYESAFAGVKKTTELTDEQYRQLDTTIKNMSATMPATYEEIAGAMEMAGQLGASTTGELQAVATAAIEMGQSTNLGAEEAATSMTRFLNVTGGSLEDVSLLGSSIVELGNNFATTEAEIMQMSMRLASSGTQAGMTQSDILAMSASMSSVGISAEAGGTAMSKTMNQMSSAVISGGADLEAFASVAGMTSEEFKTAYEKDAYGAMVTFLEGLNGVQEGGGDVNATLETLDITEMRQTDTLKRLMGATDMMKEAQDKSSKAYQEGNALSNEAAQRNETLDSKVQMLKNAWNNLKATIGAPLIGVLATVVTWLASVAQWVSNGIGGLINFVSNIKQKIGEAIGWVKNKVSEWKQMGRNMITGLVNGVKEKAYALVNAAKNAVSNAVKSVKNFLGIRSPSRLMMEFGEYTSEGFAIGIENNAGMAESAMTDMASRLQTGIDTEVGLNAYANAPEFTSVGNGAMINLNLGGTNYRAFVNDISNAQNQQVNLELAYV